MTMILGPVPCGQCYEFVRVDRIGSYVRVMEARREHACHGRGRRPEPPRPKVCGMWMPRVREKCARRAGHSMTGGHRRRIVMDDDAASRRVA